MKSKTERVLCILEAGVTLELSTGHKIRMGGDKYPAIGVVCTQNNANGPDEEILLGLDMSINRFIVECEKMTNDYLWGKTPLNRREY